jgi:putative cardiolipin synthase
VPVDQYESPPVKRLRELAPLARLEFLAMSPYFVPHDSGIELARRLHERGVTLAVLTNSLAATDAPAVHTGYAPFRVPLLRAGVQLYEFKPIGGAPETSGVVGSESKASLHAKAYVIDRQILVVGSLNLDPRSEHLNTELALVIYSSKMAGEVAELFEQGISPKVSYKVTLAPPEEVELLRSIGAPPSPLLWTAEENGHIVTYNYDPQAGPIRNFEAGIFFLLPVRDQL